MTSTNNQTQGKKINGALRAIHRCQGRPPAVGRGVREKAACRALRQCQCRPLAVCQRQGRPPAVERRVREKAARRALRRRQSRPPTVESCRRQGRPPAVGLGVREGRASCPTPAPELASGSQAHTSLCRNMGGGGGGSERLTSKDHPACRQGLNGEHLEIAVVGSGGDGRGRCGV